MSMNHGKYKNMLKLIADSGSTKTDWTWVDEKGGVIASCQSQGLNPYHLGEEEMLRELEGVKSSLGMEKSLVGKNLDAIFFYGSGVTNSMKPKVENLLLQVFPCQECHAESDMLGAARALFGHGKGIAFILGTGSNNCYYDGERIVASIPPLGYIIGDECSGTAIGKEFLRYILRNPEGKILKKHYFEYAGVDYAAIINKVYRQPQANRFLASIAPFVAKVLQECSELDRKVGMDGMKFGKSKLSDEEFVFYKASIPLTHRIVDMFDSYFNEVIPIYADMIRAQGIPKEEKVSIGFVGSIATHFSEFLDCFEGPFQLKKIVQSPMEGLITYHS